MKLDASIPQLCCAPGSDPLPEAERAVLARRFKALADPARVGIVNLLSGSEEVCVCALPDVPGLPQPTVSHRLSLPREAGIVSAEKRGPWSYYRLEQAALQDLSSALTT